jgi:predicted enzyme related to lactoylglutathione lyase
MTDGIRTFIYPARDLAKAKALYTELIGARPDTDEVYYVGYQVGDQQIGLDPHGHTDGPVAYWHVEDIRQSIQGLLDAGAEPLQDVKDVGGGKLIASVRDTDGNVIGLLQNP